MGESSSKSVTSVNSNQTASVSKSSKPEVALSNTVRILLTKDQENSFQTSSPSKLPSLVLQNSLPNVQVKSNSNIYGKDQKVKLTLQDYRKQVGLKVINQKPNQKLGITAKSESHIEGKNEQLVPLDSAVCPYCGFSVSSTTKCIRCMRSFEKEKKNLSQGLESLPGNDLPETLQMSKDPSYGNRRPRVQKAQSTRQTRTKFEEPQCVTLSSDEEDSFQETKKPKCDYSGGILQQSTASTAIEVQVQANILNETSVLPGDTEEEKGPSDLLRWKDGGLSGAFFAVNCRSVRIGSYKFAPAERVLFSSEGIMLEAPVFYANDQPSQNDSMWIDVAIPSQQLLRMEANFNRKLPVIFLYVTPTLCRRVSSGLRLDKSGPYWDPLSEDESQKRLTLLPCNLDDSAMNAIKQAFVPRGVFSEISSCEANRLLVISSPPEVRDALQRLPSGTAVSAEATRASTSSKQDVKALEASDNKSEMRITRGTTKSLPQNCLPVIQMFSWSDGPDRFSVTTEDYTCLNQDNLLNDSIIDFYVKYVFSTKLDDSLKGRCHVFSSFFYQRLTTPPARMSGRKHSVEDDSSLSSMEKRHLRVKSWTKKVDIFEKDYLVIPINERNHWFLAIVCFPGLSGPISVKDNKPVKLPFERVAKKTPDGQSKRVTLNGESFHIGNTTITPLSSNSKTAESAQVTLSVNSERDEAESDDEDILFPQDSNPVENCMKITEPIKQPCILFFDSLAGSTHNRVATILREYLTVEYQVKRGTPVENSKARVDACNLFSKKTMISACLDVPQQNNSYDCGVFVLQYAEYFMQNPFLDYNIRNIKLSNWFPSYIAGRKRKNIQFLLIRLTKEMNPTADSVLDLIPKEDVKIALQDRQHSLPALSATNNHGSEIQKAGTVAEEAMEEDGKSNVAPHNKNAAEKRAESELVGDQEKKKSELLHSVGPFLR
ncbi:sentrin-specific protease 6-like [Daphnia carinata]|uniref:sentrin-specific protease 6-like n=1 Tax=Daphnia carinata TaxID=120202 RepID=UPI00257EC2C7|nr:sentrin-specific protease 6-like [Daphnia carinata]